MDKDEDKTWCSGEVGRMEKVGKDKWGRKRDRSLGNQ